MHQASEVIADVTMIGSSMAPRRQVECDQWATEGEKRGGSVGIIIRARPGTEVEIRPPSAFTALFLSSLFGCHLLAACGSP